jgi:hypothetical protein
MDNQYKPTYTPKEPTEQDMRMQITKTIWGYSVAMLGICIPLVGIIAKPGPGAGSALLLPACVIAGAAIATVAVWLGKGRSSQGPRVAELEEQLRQLEERVANVETISSFEKGLLEREGRLGVTEAQPPSVQKDSPSVRSSTPISY